MTRHAIVRAGHGPRRTHDMEALALAAGILGVVLILCLVAAIWPEAI
jgi:hypothetical protein